MLNGFDCTQVRTLSFVESDRSVSDYKFSKTCENLTTWGSYHWFDIVVDAFLSIWQFKYTKERLKHNTMYHQETIQNTTQRSKKELRNIYIEMIVKNNFEIEYWRRYTIWLYWRYTKWLYWRCTIWLYWRWIIIFFILINIILNIYTLFMTKRKNMFIHHLTIIFIWNWLFN